MIKRISTPEGNLSFSQLSFGCGRISDSKHDRLLLEYVANRGITHFDTAVLYGSDRVIGEIFPNESSITIATKIGYPSSYYKPSITKRIYRYAFKPILANFPGVKRAILEQLSNHRLNEITQHELIKKPLLIDYVDANIEISLKNLQRDYVDCLFIHESSRFLMTDDVINHLDKIVKDGTIGSYGCASGSCLSLSDYQIGSVNIQKWSCRTADKSSKSVSMIHGLFRENGIKGFEMLDRKGDLVIIFSASVRRQVDQILSAYNDYYSADLKLSR